MRYRLSLFEMCSDSLILLVTFGLSTVSIAETYAFRVVHYEVPGEYVVSNIDAAIEFLESREKMADNHYVEAEPATLCAFYILKGNLDAARATCSAAVEIDQSDMAYNNRGVLRVHLGDTVGALEDFDRIRVLPDDLRRYIEQLTDKNLRLIAGRNFALVTKLIESRRTNEPTMTGAVTGATIEDMNP